MDNLTPTALDIPIITTTAREPFTGADSALMAYTIYKRFGRDTETACAAWRRMLQNSTPLTDFTMMVEVGRALYEMTLGGSASIMTVTKHTHEDEEDGRVWVFSDFEKGRKFWAEHELHYFASLHLEIRQLSDGEYKTTWEEWRNGSSNEKETSA